MKLASDIFCFPSEEIFYDNLILNLDIYIFLSLSHSEPKVITSYYEVFIIAFEIIKELSENENRLYQVMPFTCNWTISFTLTFSDS